MGATASRRYCGGSVLMEAAWWLLLKAMVDLVGSWITYLGMLLMSFAERICGATNAADQH
jgi:hypothetical protein